MVVNTEADLGFMRWLTVNPPEQPDLQLGLVLPGSPAYDDATTEQIRELVAKGGAGGLTELLPRSSLEGSVSGPAGGWVDADRVAEWVAHGTVGPVEAFGRLLGDLDACSWELLARRPAVVCLEDHAAAGAALGD